MQLYWGWGEGGRGVKQGALWPCENRELQKPLYREWVQALGKTIFWDHLGGQAYSNDWLMVALNTIGQW